MVQKISRSAGRSLLLSAMFLVTVSACQQPAPEPEPPANRQVAEAEPAPRQEPFSPPIPMPPVDREVLLLATMRAASAAAVGTDDHAEQESLAGKRFVVRERFGCAGPSAEGPRRWTYEEGSNALRVQYEPRLVPPGPGPAQPRRQPDTDEGTDPDPAAVYSVQYPWLLTATCLAQPAGAAPVANGRVTLVQTFTEEDSRAARLPESFKAVKRIAPEQVPATGLEFVLSGRLEEGPGGRVISCSPSSPGARPDCTVHVSIDAARVEDPAQGLLIAEWGNS